MANRLVLIVLLVGALGACGKEIGDSCNINQDCSPNGDRLCDPASRGGYCTIFGCDYSTCPGEATCVRFFTGTFTNRSCEEHICTVDGEAPTAANQAMGKGLPALDELCSVSGQCVSRSSEIRYCMKTCDSDSDCRAEYECRDLARMKLHGGEPVLAPGEVVDSNSPKFCATRPGA